MIRQNLNDLQAFLVVARERSFTKAAAQLGVSQSALSHTMRNLEARLGVRLLTRTTRSVAPTEAGQRLQHALASHIAGIETELASLMALRDTPSGHIRITLSEHALQSVVWPKLKSVLHRYPDIRLEFSLDSGFRNIVEDGFDAGVRLGESIEKDMIAVRIGPDWRLVAVAAPDYVAARPVPEHPHDLIHHTCISMRQISAGGLYAWEFSKDGSEMRIKTDGQLTFNSTAAIIQAALAGYGIGYVPENLAADHVAKGELVLLLDDWSPKFAGYHIYYPSARQSLPAFKVILDALRHRED